MQDPCNANAGVARAPVGSYDSFVQKYLQLCQAVWGPVAWSDQENSMSLNTYKPFSQP